MSDLRKSERQSPASRGAFATVWQWKSWWLLALVVLVVLIAIIYVLAHLSAADSEMYPTTTRQYVSRISRC